MNFSDYDQYEQYEDQFNPMYSDRKARRKRKPKPVHTPKKAREEIVEEIADTVGLEAGFKTTYQPARHEEAFLLDSVRTFYDQSMITDILAMVKGGKEASVYRCKGHESTGAQLLAAKVYRPRMFRNLRNDKMYRQGRQVLTGDGKIVKKNDHRVMRAIGKKTAFGQQVSHTSWLMYEYTTLQRLYEAGAAVPKPYAAGENAILMQYIGDENMAAPTLHEVDILPEEAEPLFREVMRNVEILLQHDLIHGDLSAYNILYQEGSITLIDFPQVTDINNNDEARFILERDIERICDYFSRYGVDADPQAVADAFWRRYGEQADERYQTALEQLWGLEKDDEG